MKILKVEKDSIQVELKREELESMLDVLKDDTGEFHGCFDYSRMDVKELLEEILPVHIFIEE